MENMNYNEFVFQNNKLNIGIKLVGKLLIIVSQNRNNLIN